MSLDERAASSAAHAPSRRISPTDVSQFIRLGQSARYLHLRLRERREGREFLTQAGVAAQTIPPLLTLSGSNFERDIEKAVGEKYRLIDYEQSGRTAKHNNNDDVAQLARDLPPNEVVLIFQARLREKVHGWTMRGDVDIIRMERDGAGVLRVLIADMKASTSAKVEHRLQVAFYRVMLESLFKRKQIEYGPIKLGILYRGEHVADKPGETALTDEQREQREAARLFFNAGIGFLELIKNQQDYLDAVADLVTNEGSAAQQAAEAQTAEVPYHLSFICDGCMYNEYCMKTSALSDDLSLLPYITLMDKQMLQAAGITTTRQLASLKEYRDPAKRDFTLVAAQGQEQLAGRLAITWPVGPHLDELIHRAKRYRRSQGDDTASLSYIPSKGHGTLPFCDAEHNPKLVRIFIDAQHDFLEDRVYLLGALIVANEGGEEKEDGRRYVVRITDGPPNFATERDLFRDWISAVLIALDEVVNPDAEGHKAAPIHLIFFNRFVQQVLLDGLSRHLPEVLAVTHLYDFITQLPAFDSPLISYLEDEMRELKNYPMLAQSLQAVAAYLKFNWRTPEDYRELFRDQLFDAGRKLDANEVPQGERPWYTARARFNSQIPLEYVYAGWGKLPPAPMGKRDPFAHYRHGTIGSVAGFQRRRLEAIEWISKDFRGNHLTVKGDFSLPDLALFSAGGISLARSLDEFVTIERHVELGAWRGIRNLSPERRLLMGETLIVSYHEADQTAEVVAANEAGREKQALYKARQAEGVELSAEESKALAWSTDGWKLKLQMESGDTGADLDSLLALSDLRAGERVVLYPRWTYDERLAPEERTPNTPTPKQLLYAARADINRISVERDESGATQRVWVELTLVASFVGDAGHKAGFTFPGSSHQVMDDGALYTLDVDVNSYYGYWTKQVAAGLLANEQSVSSGQNTLYERLAHPDDAKVRWGSAEAAGQRRFLAGLAALGGPFEQDLHAFDEPQADYIGEYGAEPLLLVQGPPGTGKSYSTAFAIFARIQGALAAGRQFRVLLSCKTHAATDVLLEDMLKVQRILLQHSRRRPDVFKSYINGDLLKVPLYRLYPRGSEGGDAAATAGGQGDAAVGQAEEAASDGLHIEKLVQDKERPWGQKQVADFLSKQPLAVVAGPPGGIWKMVTEKWGKALFGHELVHCLVLDEASQMNLPEAMMAALPLARDGQVIVVGDDRQMAPIVHNDWEGEPRRTFQQYKSYQSLFASVRQVIGAPQVQFRRSFRLHASMAEFLRQAIYAEDHIELYSNLFGLLAGAELADEFVAAVLRPEHPIVLVVHDEAGSQTSNEFEQKLIGPLLSSLAGPPFSLDPQKGLGVVVPHRAQRAGLQARYGDVLNVLDPATGLVRSSAVDTVERFQGSEREVIVISATESSRDYLLMAGEFLFEPSRLTVALSRAKRKMVLVASRSIFTLFNSGDEAFKNSLLWKRLLRDTCTVGLWEGQVEGVRVQVWGNKLAEGSGG